MNQTHYIGHRPNSLGHFARRTSLDLLKGGKAFLIKQQDDNFRKSHSSLDKNKFNSKNHSEQMNDSKYEKSISTNIYFNPKSRQTYFKNLIDSYFEKNPINQTTQNNNKNNKLNQISQKKPFAFRKNILLSKNKLQHTQINHQNNKSKQPFPSNIINQRKIFNQSPLGLSQDKDTKEEKIQSKKDISSIRYKKLSESVKDIQDYDAQMRKFTQKNIKSYENSAQNSAPITQNFIQFSFLPKITEACDDGSEEQFSSAKQFSFTEDAPFFLRSQSSFNRLEQKKHLIYQNSICKFYNTKENEKKYRIKEFKSKVFLERHQRACEQGAYSFWKPFQFNQLSLIMPFILPLKDLLFRLTPHPTSPDYFYLIPKPFYTKLTANNCQQLVLLFKQFIKDIARTGKRIINNKINLSNIFYVKGKLCLADWEYSAFKEENKIQGNHFQSRIEPILKFDKQWLVSPQYLSPEILDSIQHLQKPFNLWEFENISDVYSIGVTFLEIITQIPVWMQLKTIIQGKMMKPRQGCLFTSNRSTLRIIEKQKCFIGRVTNILQRQVDESSKNWKFFDLLLKMVQPLPRKRISMEQIIKQLQ